MQPNQGPLQTGEHILAKIMEGKVADLRVGIAKFQETSGILEVMTQTDIRSFDLAELQKDVHAIIARHLDVVKTVLPRAVAGKITDLRKLPDAVTEVRIVQISDFDRRPCRDPHVNNTREIGNFRIDNLERVGKDRYRFTFSIAD